MAEFFIKTFKMDYVHFSQLTDAKTAMEQLHMWFEEDKKNHPHKSLNIRLPRSLSEYLCA